MKTIYRTDNGVLNELNDYDIDSWVSLIRPTVDEISEVAEQYQIDATDLRAALDEEESSRVQLEEGYTLILVDMPLEEVRNGQNAYTTFPLGIVLKKDVIITICSKESLIISGFLQGRVKSFSTKKKMRFIYQLLLSITNLYQTYLRMIDRKRVEIERRVTSTTPEDADLIILHELESNLVYFTTSLSANSIVLERLSRYERLKQYPEDKELLDDVIIENRQAIEMTNVNRDIMHGARELVSTIINNRLNNVMKFLTSITLVMAIPTIISGIYGMNVASKWMPLSETPYGFYIICAITALICLLSLILLKRRKMLS